MTRRTLAGRVRLAPLAAALAFTLLAGLALPGAADDGKNVDKVMGGITAQSGQTYGELSTVNGGVSVEAGAVTRDISTVNGGIRIGAGAKVGDAETVNGGMHLDADVTAGRIETVNGAVRLGARNSAERVETVNGGVFIDSGSRIARGVETVNGAIGIVATEVGGDIATVNGDITIGVDSHVRGGIRIKKPGNNWTPVGTGRRVPRVVIAPRARVDGTLKFEREVKLYVHDSATVGTVEGATVVRYSTERAPKD